ncbi:hypothetical protein JTB14_025662 [Gonioctena quinquepunctata]|nr:hypothetical protein JTB14_025662 [Gonioctena quinquepunctata]
MRQYREEDRPIMMDETYIHSSHTQGKGWSDETLDGLQKPIGYGPRLIIVHAGGKNGFVPDANIRWRSHSTRGDYHHDNSFAIYNQKVLW